MKKLKVNNYPMVSPTPIVIVGTAVNGQANYTLGRKVGDVFQEGQSIKTLTKNTTHNPENMV